MQINDSGGGVCHTRLHMLEVLLVLGVGLVLGFVAGYFSYRIYFASIRHAAEVEAQDLLAQAREAAANQDVELSERQQEIETELWAKVEESLQKAEERIEEGEELAEEKKQKHEQAIHREKSALGQVEREVTLAGQALKQLESAIESKRGRNEGVVSDIVGRLCERTGEPKAAVVERLQKDLVTEAERLSQGLIDARVADAQEHVEIYAKAILQRTILRFQRPYSAERGIAPVYFETPEQRKILCDAEGVNLRTITECTGCDVIVEEGMDLVGVAGFDPVRRELTRRVLERCLKERRPIRPDFIRKTSDNIKRELFSLIRKDGDALAKELRLESVHPEIRQMMGSLRYRYSFTQNQYFHCGEVGWLCGLLASELGTVSQKKARRSGMLHDLGKSMDHQLEGGHAVIGANFIQARGEAADVVHAVRAHHYDEAPSTDMAFLVIAADAISGARPGARRSTIESYNQKVSELESIAKSFDGVTDCFVLNGGRECRVLVNSKVVDDMSALAVSKKIADRIQNECSYPGQIKVVVVRETVAVEATRTA